MKDGHERPIHRAFLRHITALLDSSALKKKSPLPFGKRAPTSEMRQCFHCRFLKYFYLTAVAEKRILGK